MLRSISMLRDYFNRIRWLALTGDYSVMPFLCDVIRAFGPLPRLRLLSLVDSFAARKAVSSVDPYTYYAPNATSTNRPAAVDDDIIT